MKHRLACGLLGLWCLFLLGFIVWTEWRDIVAVTSDPCLLSEPYNALHKDAIKCPQ